MNVLVVGGTGATGIFVVNGLIARGHRVTIAHRGVHEVDFARPVEHIHCDPNFAETLSDALGTRRFDAIVAMYGRLRQVAQVAKGRTPRLVAVGAVAYTKSYEIPSREDAAMENDPANKLLHNIWLAQQEVMEVHRQGHYSVTYLAYPRIYGPRQPAPQEWSIIRRILDGREQILLPDGGLRIDCRGYVENAANAVLLAVDKEVAAGGNFYNVADEWSPTLRQRVELIAEIMGARVELVNIPGELAIPSYAYWASGSVSGWRGGPIDDAHHRLRDTSKIKIELGYKDVVVVPEAIRRTVQWYLEHRPEPGGEDERQLGDPFDYRAEDLYVRLANEYADKLRAVPFAGVRFDHPYDHPKTPMKL